MRCEILNSNHPKSGQDKSGSVGGAGTGKQTVGTDLSGTLRMDKRDQ